MCKAAQILLQQIAEDADEDGAVIGGEVLDNAEDGSGQDAQVGEFKDLIAGDYVDR